MNTVIEVENISKLYRLGEFGTGTLGHDLHRWWSKLRGKDDPFFKIGEINDRTVKGTSNFVWSLRDINFEVKQGDAVGIIGRNGAGKSTLLKLLSQITAPTTGIIKAHGRIASLLEVGTGFHPELTGRENIFLNGAILGMRKNEIIRKFDEIVDFSGVERYIDTPVKRYSSGMYVRLAFAVAAYLESEILIVDEVLAVGDAEFQRKCLGKMGDVSKGEGRTVLFVSHNMSAVSTLCNTGIYLKNGNLINKGNINDIVSAYLGDGQNAERLQWIGNEGNKDIRILKTVVYAADKLNGFHTNTDVFIEIEGEILQPVMDLVLGFTLWSQFEYELAYVLHDDTEEEHTTLPEQQFKKTFKIPANTLAEGDYRIQFDVGIHNKEKIIDTECDLSFSLVNINGLGRKFLVGSGKGKTSLFRTNWLVK
ncbi:MAG: Polysaccharide transporter, ATP-binding protein [Mucilaginibacter sp.]|nr:Polysaccharide transporter, ATP-binding protein [Mucilaginibacter sp.]